MVTAMRECLGVDVYVPEMADMTGAVGAAQSGMKYEV